MLGMLLTMLPLLMVLLLLLLLARMIEQRMRGSTVRIAVLLGRRHIGPRGQHVVFDFALIAAAQDAEEAVLAPPGAPRVGGNLYNRPTNIYSMLCHYLT